VSAPVIQIEGLSFAYGESPVLTDVSCSVEQGERLSIVGPNGAGKSTLIKCLVRLVPGFSGSVSVQGQNLATYSQRDLARVLSYVPQADGRQFPFTVRDFVAMGRYPHLSAFTARRAEDEAAIDRALDRAGLVQLADRPMDQLSGGERQRLFIAAAIAQEAPVLLLDEPTTFLDPMHQREVEKVLADLHEECNVTLVSVTHDLNRALRHTDRVLALKEGRVHYLGAPSGLLEGGHLEKLFGRSFNLATHPDGGPMILPD
jgi:iron complex transport system ATP-binding protein